MLWYKKENYNLHLYLELLGMWGRTQKMLIDDKPDLELYFFLPNLKFGGAEKVLISFANKESSRRAKVTIIVGNANGELRSEIDKKVNVIDLKKNKVLACLPFLVKLAFINRNIHLFTTMYHCNVMCCIVKVLFPQTCVTIRESTSLEFYQSHFSTIKFKVFKFLARTLYPIADELIFPSRDMEKTFIKFSDRKSNHIVVPNPVDEKLISAMSEETIPDSLWKPKSKNIFINVGRVDTNKNQIMILQALAEMKDKDFEFILVGDGPELNNLKSFVLEKGLEERVTFLGYQPNPFKFMKKASIFIMSSLREGYPNVLAQSKFLNLRIISTDCPTGPREILEDYDKGKLINFSPIELRKELLKFL